MGVIDPRDAQTPIDLNLESRDIVHLVRGEALRQLETEILPTHIAARRWYGAKEAGFPKVEIADVTPFGPAEDLMLLTILRVSAPGRAAQNYFLPLTLMRDAVADMPPSAMIATVQCGGAPTYLVDAFADDGFVRLLLAKIRGDGDCSEDLGLVLRRTTALADVEDDLDGAIERSAAEQSNTSIRVAGAMLKAFRKLEPGIHPELEMTRFLTERAQFRNVPALLGSIERIDRSGDATALCVLQALVSNQGDGWTYAVERFKRARHEEDRRPELVRLACQIGKRTAELHHALAMPTDDEAFAPERVEERHLSEWADAVRAQARTALNGLEQADCLEPAVRAEADRLLGRRQQLTERIGRSTPLGLNVVRTRLHGDYHLGQVLVSDGDVYIIDFEGEPMRPLAERRAKHSPLKDVAGMLRSFAYASAAAARSLPAEERATAAEQLEAIARDMSTAFTEKYNQAIRGCPSYPADPAHANSLLRLFLLEKALYEVSYELANRPKWIGIPLAGVLALLDRDALY
jgi:trehalose synthase-fused probable maltokinase